MFPVDTVVFFNVWSPKGNKQENEVREGEEHWSFKSHGSHLGGVGPGLQQSRRGKNNGCLPLCLQVCDQMKQ